MREDDLGALGLHPRLRPSVGRAKQRQSLARQLARELLVFRGLLGSGAQPGAPAVEELYNQLRPNLNDGSHLEPTPQRR